MHDWEMKTYEPKTAENLVVLWKKKSVLVAL